MSAPLTEQEILEKLTAIFRQVFDDETIIARPEMTAADVKRWDSLSHIDMIVLVEEAFGIRLPTREVVRLQNVGDLIRVLQHREQ
jgi:acyl carrier protein